MNKFTKAIAAIMLIVASIIVAGCNKPDEPNNGGNNNGGVNDGSDGTVMVATLEPNDITATTALCHAEITLSGGLTFKELGVCWSTHENPTINDAHLFTDTPGAGAFTCTITNLEPNTAYHVRAYALLDTVCYYGEDKTFTTEEDPGNYDGHDYVDLGLPSGTLWATCNVGAETPEGYGDYFAWGETRTKDNYEWSTYKYSINSECSLTKYCSDVNYGYDGFTDTLTFLLSEDDAAMVNLGDECRIPSEKEWEELYQNTTSIWTSKNGVNGRLLTASNGNNIFLPAAGFRHGYELVNDGSKGHYWSNKIFINLPYYVRGFNFTSGTCYMGEDGRLYGLSVRPVRSAK